MTTDAAGAIRDLIGRGEFLLAADRGLEAMGDDPVTADMEIVWLTALALARCGAVGRAESLLATSDLVARAADAAPARREDVLALRARLVKDRALATEGGVRAALAEEAASAYAEAAAQTGSAYALANAATMHLVAGDTGAARSVARQALTAIEGDDYWAAATQAEALLVVGEVDAAADALRRAAGTDPDWSMRSTTARQLSLVCETTGIDVDVLDALPLPTVCHYTGHMFAAGPEDELRRRIADELRDLDVGAVYGSLACGADLLVAETARTLGLEVHAVLPCPVPDFVERSVRPGGADWVTRFDAALDTATSAVIEPTRALADESMFAFADQLAMGFSLARASHLGCGAHQLALWDGVASTGVAGTAAAVARWRATGRETTVIDLARDGLAPVAAPSPTPDDERRPRSVKALLFADIVGFSALAEDRVPDFFEQVMARLATVIERHGDRVRSRSTWGDAIHLVLDTATDAAHLALEIQDELRAARDALAWPSLSARIGGHAGPVFHGFDHVTGFDTFYGTHVTRAARIEPRTPPGEVYVTESFAALVALDGSTSTRLEYVGHVPTAKNYGSFPMYVLRR